MTNTDRLNMPLLAAAQAQKHVTHNAALKTIDTLLQGTVTDRDLTAPPVSPNAGDCYIVASGGSGDWASHDNDLAVFQDDNWIFISPKAGWRFWLLDEGVQLVFDGSAWLAALVITPNQAFTGIAMLEEEVTLSGATTDTSIVIPDRAIVLGVSTRTTEVITGATSYDCGDGTTDDKFGGLLGIALNSTNAGVIGPTAYYADTAIRFTANGGNFTAGKVRVAIHYMVCQTSQS